MLNERGNKTVLLLGGTGTISYTVMNDALDSGFDVSVMNRGKRGKKLPPNVHCYICDFKNENEIRKVFENSRFDVVVDFLSRNADDIKRVYPILGNVCTQYVFVSSSCVYRREKDDFPIKECSPKPNEDWTYNVEKYETELELKSLYEKKSDLDCYFTIVRPYITYDDERVPFGIAPAYKYHRTIIERIKANKPMFLWDNGTPITTLTSVKDFSKGMVGLFCNKKAKNEDFHITSDFSYSWKDVLKMLYQKIGAEYNVINLSSEEVGSYLPNYRGMILGDRKLNAVFDNSKIKAAVPGLRFEQTLGMGIDSILKYYESLDSYEYDYMFDAQIDRMLSSKSPVALKYCRYRNSKGYSRVLYFLYRNFSFSTASRIRKLLNKLKINV